MGMDVYGKNPKLTSVRPEIDWANTTKENGQAYLKIVQEWEEENPGYYFRANVWSWRPIQMIIDMANDAFDLEIDTSSYGTNDGAGLDTQEECDKLADGIEAVLKLDKEMDGDRIYMSLGMWVNYEGNFNVDAEIQRELNLQYPTGTILTSSVVASNGTLVCPPWSISRSHINEFVKFLRHCGGFKIC
jgi:hypothetical protein